MALREVVGKPGTFFDDVTGREFTIMEPRDTVRAAPPRAAPPPWWSRLRDAATNKMIDMVRFNTLSMSDGALLATYVQSLCNELDTFQKTYEELRARENGLWSQRTELERKNNEVQEENTRLKAALLDERRARRRRKRR